MSFLVSLWKQSVQSSVVAGVRATLDSSLTHCPSSTTTNPSCPPLDVVEPTLDTESRCQLVRDKLLSEFAENKDLFEQRDLVQFVQDGNGYIKRYLERRDQDVERTFEMMRSALAWRKRIEMSQFDDLSFPREFYAIGALFQYTADKDGNALLIYRSKTYKNVTELREGIEMFTVYKMFEAHRRGADDSRPELGWTFLFDVTGISVMHYDAAPQLGWLITTLVSYFPTGLRKVIVFNTPFFFRPFVALVMKFIPKEWRHIITFVNGGALFDHFDKDQLPDFMGGTCALDYRKVPDGARPVEEMAFERYGMSKAQCDRIRVHFDKYFKE